MAVDDSTIHASAVLVGARALLIVGPAGSGKSRLVLKLLQAADAGLLPFARLVADDRARIGTCHGRLIVRPADQLKGLIEVRGLGIRRMAFEPAAIVGLVIDLAETDAQRLPSQQDQETFIAGVKLARLAVAPGIDAIPLIFCWRGSQPAYAL
jgi:serine kinase of HPr protein (carbohydrate metabolism regulator)